MSFSSLDKYSQASASARAHARVPNAIQNASLGVINCSGEEKIKYVGQCIREDLHATKYSDTTYD
jgi:hypothetical protein